MYKRIFTLSVLAAVTLAFFYYAYAAAPIAVVIKSKGAASLKRADRKDNGKIKRGVRLYSGDKIITGKKGFVAIKFIDDGSLVRIRSNSTCTVKGKKEKNSIAKNIYVEVGTIFSKITRQKSRFRISTPTSVASVKGTAFWTKQEFKGATYYFGEEGVIEISNKEGSALVKAGETGIVSSPNSKPVVRKTKAGEKPQNDDDATFDDYELEFKNSQGETKVLKFKIKKNQ